MTYVKTPQQPRDEDRVLVVFGSRPVEMTPEQATTFVGIKPVLSHYGTRCALSVGHHGIVVGLFGEPVT